MIPIEGLGLVCLSLTTTIFFPILLYAYILDFLPELTLFLNFRACCSRFTERRGEDGTMMKINLNFSCAKSPRLTRPWVTYSQPNFQENRSHCPIFFMPKTLSNQIMGRWLLKNQSEPPRCLLGTYCPLLFLALTVRALSVPLTSQAPL